MHGRHGIYDPSYGGDDINATQVASADLYTRRRETRVNCTLEGRVLIGQNQEESCQIINVSANGIAVSCLIRPTPCTRVIFHFDLLGRFEGSVVRELYSGFAASIVATRQKQDQLRARINWLVHNPDFVAALKRRHFRLTPTNTWVTVSADDGSEGKAELLTISLSGAGVKSELKPPIETIVTLGSTRARVVRHFPGGFAAEFLRLIPLEKLDDSIQL